jgi:tetratricopeptide (TPR) repeat protein
MLLEFCFLIAGRPADAARECHRILELDENYHLAYLHLSFGHAQQGELEKAVSTADKAHSLAPWNLTITGYLAGLLKRTGDVSRAVTMLQKLGDGKAYGAPLGFVYYYLVCSEIDQAANWAEKAIEQRAQAIPAVLRLPLAKELRSSSRWPALAKMMNLPEAV